MGIVYIYGLECPVRNEIMYVGKSLNVSARLAQHIMDAKSGVDSPKCEWIRSLIAHGLRPTAKILDTCDPVLSWDAESKWIEIYRSLNHCLTNVPYEDRKRFRPSALAPTEPICDVDVSIFDAVNRLEKQNGRRYTESQIAKATGLHRHTIATLMRGKPDRVIVKLLHFFASEGMPVTVKDLFVTLPAAESEPPR
jgi:hypothetical protein